MTAITSSLACGHYTHDSLASRIGIDYDHPLHPGTIWLVDLQRGERRAVPLRWLPERLNSRPEL